MVFVTEKPSYAAPSMAQDECLVMGMVVSENYRKTENNSIPSARRWYHDIVLKITSKDIHKDVQYDDRNCRVDPNSQVETFQMPDEPNAIERFKSAPNSYLEKCIQAKTRFFADDFGGGNWLSDIEVFPKEKCQK